MIKGKLKLDIFKGWSIKYVIAEKLNDKDAIKEFKKSGVSQEFMDETLIDLKENGSGAILFSNVANLDFYIVFFATNDKITLIENITHETCHIVQAVVKHLEIEDDETEAYLTGYINKEIIKKIL